MNDEIIIKKYEDVDEDRWNRFVSNSKNPLFMFDREYMDYHSDRFDDFSLMFLKRDSIIAVLPATIKNSTVISHGGLTYGGFIIDVNAKQHTINDCVKKMISFFRAEGIKRFLYKPIPHIYHKQPCEEDIYALFNSGARPIEMAASTVVNLLEPLKMSKGRKAQISRAKREGVDIQKLDDKMSFESFIDLENTVLESRHKVKAVHTAEELFMLFERFPQNIHLFGALYKDELIAGTVVYEYNSVIHTQYMAANEMARKIGALDLAISMVIYEYKISKKWLDFGISTEDGGRYLNEGLISQKEGFGGRTNIYQLWEMNIEECDVN